MSDPRLREISEPEGTHAPRGRSDPRLQALFAPAGTILGDAEAGAEPSATGRDQRNMRAVVKALKHTCQSSSLPMDVYPSTVDAGFWKVVLQGPSSSPYASGTFLLSVFLPADFPIAPPQVRFVTPMMHCNVTQYGRICSAILGRAWTSDTSVLQVLENLNGLMLTPDTVDPLNSALALRFYEADGSYEAAILTHVRQHASKSRRQWQAELGEA